MVLATLLLGCSGAEWQQVEIEDGYQPPQVVRVSVAAPPHLQEVRQVFEAALLDELDDEGIRASLVPASSSQADASVTIHKWNPGERGLRWICACAGKGEIFVELSSLGIDGDARGYVAGGFFGGDSHNSATAAASLIAETIAKGQRALPRDRRSW